MHTQLKRMSAILIVVGCGSPEVDKSDDNVDIYDQGDPSDGGSDDGGSDTGGSDDGGSDDGGSDDGGSDDGGSDTSGGSGSSDPGTGPVDSVGFPPCSDEEGHATTIAHVGPTVDGVLELSVAYSGGCEEHEFELCWPDQSFMESMPVQAMLEVLHTGPTDDCDAWIEETLYFDVTTMAEAYTVVYASETGEILLRFGDDTSLYTF